MVKKIKGEPTYRYFLMGLRRNEAKFFFLTTAPEECKSEEEALTWYKKNVLPKRKEEPYKIEGRRMQIGWNQKRKTSNSKKSK